MKKTVFTQEADKIIIQHTIADETKNTLQSKCLNARRALFQQIGLQVSRQVVYNRHRELKASIINSNIEKQKELEENKYHSDPIKNEEAKQIIEASNKQPLRRLLDQLEMLNQKELKMVSAYIDYLSI